MRLKGKSCYMCGKPAVTAEHAPPKSFFPQGEKTNLITVPSCWTHNNDNNEDVEYVRNAIVGSGAVNNIGFEIFSTKGVRSLDRSDKLFRQLFGKVRPFAVNGEATFVYKINLVRFNKIMRGVANALFFKDFKRRYPHPQNWWIYSTALISERDYRGLPDEANARIRDAAHRLTVTDRHTGMPEVFQYAIYQESDEKTIYRILFYEGVTVYAIGYSEEARPRLHPQARI